MTSSTPKSYINLCPGDTKLISSIELTLNLNVLSGMLIVIISRIGSKIRVLILVRI
jgi:hypothetical protein